MGSEKKTAHPILSQSLFQTTYVRAGTRSYATSSVLHAAIAILLLITVPAIHNVQKPPPEHVTLVAPPLPTYKLKTLPPAPRRVEPLHEIVRNEPKPKIPPVIKPPEVKPVAMPHREVAKAPEIKTEINPVRSLPELRPEPPAPKPPVHTGTFQPVELAKAAPASKELKIGGFGDPHGVPASANSHPSPVTLAQVGSFDQPVGSGRSGGGGRGASGGVRQTSFGSPGDSADALGGTGRGSGTVSTGSFGETTAGQPSASAARPKPAQPAFSPVEILSKPKPRYTEEARNLKFEGQVSLEVVFQANGSVRILRIVHGLGHGLDEAAEQAASQVRFRPATRGGVPVDSNATIHITFQLT